MHDTFSRSNTDTESSHLKPVWCSVQEKSGSSNLVGGRKCNQFRIILASSNCASRRRAPSFMACQMFVPWRRGWVEEEKKGWSVTEDLEFILESVPAINQRWSSWKTERDIKEKNYSFLAISFLHKLFSLIINFDFVCFAIFWLEIWCSDSDSEPLRSTLVCIKTILYFGRISFWHGWTTKSCRKVMKKRSNVKVMAEPLFTLVKVGANQKKRGLLENFWFWFSKFCMRRQESKTSI